MCDDIQGHFLSFSGTREQNVCESKTREQTCVSFKSEIRASFLNRYPTPTIVPISGMDPKFRKQSPARLTKKTVSISDCWSHGMQVHEKRSHAKDTTVFFVSLQRMTSHIQCQGFIPRPVRSDRFARIEKEQSWILFKNFISKPKMISLCYNIRP